MYLSDHPLTAPTATYDPHDEQSLTDLVRRIDAQLVHERDGALLRVTGDPPRVHRMSLGGDHPLDLLLGFRAPRSWIGIGLHCKGRSFDLPEPRRTRPPRRSSSYASRVLDALPISVTILIDRAGHGRGLLRQGDDTRCLAGPPEGIVGDACRRVLGLPTPPPPPDTAALWLQLWLDRVVVEATEHSSRGRPISWDAVTLLHPGARSVDGERDPEALAEATLALTDALPWHRLRCDPETIITAGPPLARDVAEWMDDGMYARWLLNELTDIRTLARTLDGCLPIDTLHQIAATFAFTGMAWPLEGDR